MNRLLILLAPQPHWLRLVGDTVVARGSGLPTTAPGTDAAFDSGAITILAVPSEAVGLAWRDLPALAPAQAAAAARLLLADAVAPAAEALHFAVAPGAGLRAVAWVDPARLGDWLAEVAAAGIDPDHVIPDVLLLPAATGAALPAATGAALPAATGDTLMVWHQGDRLLARGPARAFAGEAALADIMLGDAPRRELADWQAGLGTRLAELPIDLRQGGFARRRAGPAVVWRWRRLAVLAAAAAGLWLAGDAAQTLRATLAADLVAQRTADAARAALPRGSVIAADTALPLLRARAAKLGAGGGFGGAVAPLLDSLAVQPGTRLTRLDHDAGSGLMITLRDGNRDALLAALAARGVAAQTDGPNRLRVPAP